MITLPTGTRIWIIAGVTDIRCGFNGLASKVQNTLKDNPLSGHIFVYRGLSGKMVKFAYLLKQWDALNEYCRNGWVEIDNNLCENALGVVAPGRRNDMFFGSDGSGDSAAVMYSLIGSCKLNGIGPEAWLRHVISVINTWPANRVKELLPWNVTLSVNSFLPHVLHEALMLKSANMMKNRRLARHAGDAAWSGFVAKLAYKAEPAGGHLVKLNQWFASSKICHCCGHKMPEMSLTVREWKCPGCNADHDRDINAAINIHHKDITELMAASHVVKAHRGLRQSGSMSVAA